MHFERTPRKMKAIPMTALTDVLFNLLIFFMLSTNFIHTESMELSIPPTVNVGVPKDSSNVIRIYLAESGAAYLEKEQLSTYNLRIQLRRTLASDPARGVVVLTSRGVTVQQLVNIMDQVYLAGGRNLSVANWDQPQEAS